MWLSALGKRTPKGYFLFLSLGGLLALLPLLASSGQSEAVLPVRSDLIPLYLRPLLLLTFAFFCNRIFVVSDLFNRNTLWPGHTYLLLLLLFCLDLPLWKAATHGAFGLLVTYNLLRIQYNQDARTQSFNLGLLNGAAVFLLPVMLLVTPFLLMGMRSLRPISFKELMLFLLGLATPFYFFWGYCFLTDNFASWYSFFDVADWFFFHRITLSGVLKWIPVMLAAFLTSALLLLRYNSAAVRFRRLITAVLYLIAGLSAVALASGLNAGVIYYLSPLISLCATMLMLRYTKSPSLEIIHLIFVTGVLGILLIGSL